MKHPISNRAVTYARTSGRTQDEKLSHGGQDTIMVPYCKEKGLHIVRSFYEVASALDTINRPEFLDMMRFVLDPANNISHVVFHDLSRFSRSKADPQTYLNLLDEHDIIIHSAQDKTNSDDDNELLWDILFIFNNQFSKTISQLTIRGQSESVMMGNDISPVVTYGFEKYYVKEDVKEDGKKTVGCAPGGGPTPYTRNTSNSSSRCGTRNTSPWRSATILTGWKSRPPGRAVDHRHHHQHAPEHRIHRILPGWQDALLQVSKTPEEARAGPEPQGPPSPGRGRVVLPGAGSHAKETQGRETSTHIPHQPQSAELPREVRQSRPRCQYGRRQFDKRRQESDVLGQEEFGHPILLHSGRGVGRPAENRGEIAEGTTFQSGNTPGTT